MWFRRRKAPASAPVDTSVTLEWHAFQRAGRRFLTGRLGTMMQEDLLAGFAALEALYTQTGSAEEFHRLVSQLPAEWESYHPLYRFFYFYGQK